MLKRWARPLMVAYAIATICFVVITLVMNTIVVVPELSRQFAAMGAPSVGAPIAIVWLYLFTLMGLVYPVFVSIFFRKPHVVAAFDGARTL